MKPGWQTTEFWITLLTNIVGIVNLFHPVVVSAGTIGAVAGVLVLIVTNVAYILSRAHVKSAASVAAALPAK